MNDIPMPEILHRLPPSDVLHAITRAGIHLNTAERDRLCQAMRETIKENQQNYREAYGRIIRAA